MQKSRKKLIIIALFLILIITAILYYDYVVLPLVCTLATEEIRSEVISIINYANTYLQTLTLFYEDYFTVFYDNDNKVSAIVANTGLINQINMILQKQVQTQLNSLRTKTITLPAGAFTGSSLLSAFGSEIPLSLEAICNCYTTLENTYESVGINQVRHSLVVSMHVDMEIIIPIRSEETTAYTDLIMAESIIVGEVPSTYLVGNTVDGMSDYLNLLP